MGSLNAEIKNLENNLLNLFDLLLLGDFIKNPDSIIVVNDAFNDLTSKLMQLDMEGLATYFGYLQANWEEIESFEGEQFASIQNCIMISLSIFDPESDLEFMEQIKKALLQWAWPIEVEKEFISQIIEDMNVEIIPLLNNQPLEIQSVDEDNDDDEQSGPGPEESNVSNTSELEKRESGQKISIKSIYNDFSQRTSSLPISFDIEPLEFTEKQNEIILLFVDELLDLSKSLEISVNPENISEKLNETSFYIENLIGAADVISYSELSEILKLIQLAIETLDSKETVSLDEYENTIIWPLVINNLFASGINNESIHLISQYIQSLIPELDAETADTICMSLVSIDLNVLESDKRSEQSIATAEDLSLIPEDEKNPELLQSFFDELEDYTANYTLAINNFITNKDFNELDVARRVVHTIKGSGNTTGIKGIANYTHNLEDILDELSKKNIIPSDSLSELLKESADYLEIMCESILHGTEVPEELIANYQKILDWAYALDNGLTIEDLENVDNYTKEINDTTEQVTEENNEIIVEEGSNELVKPPIVAVTSTDTIRVTKSQIEDLIRVVGENMISSGQVLEHAQQNKVRLDLAQKQYLTLNNLILDLEQLVFVRGINSDREKSKGEFDPLEMERYNELHTATQRIIESSLDGMEMLKKSLESNLKLEVVAVDQIQLQRDNQDQVIQMRMLPVSFVANRFARAVRQTCRKTNKKVNFKLLGENTFVDSNVLQELIEPIMHILRNSIDHGIENEDQRLALNKSAEGNITLKFERIADHISVKCIDDGQGLNYEKIIATARKKNLINENQLTFSPEEITRFILIPGFSTKDELSHVSGRGIGMDVVNQKIHEIRGSLKINSESNKGTEISISIPVSLMSTHALLLDIGETQFAISNRGIEDIIYLDAQAIAGVKQNNLIHWNNEALNVYSLADLLMLEREHQDIDKIAIIVSLSDGSYKAVISPFIKNSMDLVVKPLSKILPRIDGLIGASVLGDGSVAPVYDLTELNEKFVADDYIYNSSSAKIQESYNQLLPCVLVVDDSISARRSMANFVKDLGFNVIEANDGMEAQEQLLSNKIVLVITDLEMPRMNGFDLASHMQSRDDFSDIPVIMVTSRSTEKHKTIAKKSGVKEYIVKPFDEDFLAEKLNEMLS